MTSDLTGLFDGLAANAVIRAMEQGVWRRSTDSTVYGAAALTVKARGYVCAQAGGLADAYDALAEAAARHGEGAVLAAARAVVEGRA